MNDYNAPAAHWTVDTSAPAKPEQRDAVHWEGEVMLHAHANYENQQEAWDHVIECYTADEIRAALGSGRCTLATAKRRLVREFALDLIAEQRSGHAFESSYS